MKKSSLMQTNTIMLPSNKDSNTNNAINQVIEMCKNYTDQKIAEILQQISSDFITEESLQCYAKGEDVVGNDDFEQFKEGELKNLVEKNLNERIKIEVTDIVPPDYIVNENFEKIIIDSQEILLSQTLDNFLPSSEEVDDENGGDEVNEVNETNDDMIVVDDSGITITSPFYIKIPNNQMLPPSLSLSGMESNRIKFPSSIFTGDFIIISSDNDLEGSIIYGIQSLNESFSINISENSPVMMESTNNNIFFFINSLEIDLITFNNKLTIGSSNEDNIEIKGNVSLDNLNLNTLTVDSTSCFKNVLTLPRINQLRSEFKLTSINGSYPLEIKTTVTTSSTTTRLSIENMNEPLSTHFQSTSSNESLDELSLDNLNNYYIHILSSNPVLNEYFKRDNGVKIIQARSVIKVKDTCIELEVSENQLVTFQFSSPIITVNYNSFTYEITLTEDTIFSNITDITNLIYIAFTIKSIKKIVDEDSVTEVSIDTFVGDPPDMFSNIDIGIWSYSNNVLEFGFNEEITNYVLSQQWKSPNIYTDYTLYISPVFIQDKNLNNITLSNTQIRLKSNKDIILDGNVIIKGNLNYEGLAHINTDEVVIGNLAICLTSSPVTANIDCCGNSIELQPESTAIINNFGESTSKIVCSKNNFTFDKRIITSYLTIQNNNLRINALGSDDRFKNISFNSTQIRNSSRGCKLKIFSSVLINAVRDNNASTNSVGYFSYDDNNNIQNHTFLDSVFHLFSNVTDGDLTRIINRSSTTNSNNNNGRESNFINRNFIGVANNRGGNRRNFVISNTFTREVLNNWDGLNNSRIYSLLSNLNNEDNTNRIYTFTDDNANQLLNISLGYREGHSSLKIDIETEYIASWSTIPLFFFPKLELLIQNNTSSSGTENFPTITRRNRKLTSINEQWYTMDNFIGINTGGYITAGRDNTFIALLNRRQFPDRDINNNYFGFLGYVGSYEYDKVYGSIISIKMAPLFRSNRNARQGGSFTINADIKITGLGAFAINNNN